MRKDSGSMAWVRLATFLLSSIDESIAGSSTLLPSSIPLPSRFSFLYVHLFTHLHEVHIPVTLETCDILFNSFVMNTCYKRTDVLNFSLHVSLPNCHPADPPNWNPGRQFPLAISKSFHGIPWSKVRTSFSRYFLHIFDVTVYKERLFQ